MENVMVRICLISDTHNMHKRLGKLPDADIIIHSGDMTSVGHEHEIKNFMKWFSGLTQYEHKICIAGNHDWLFQREGLRARSLVPDNIHYLENDFVMIEDLMFYGTPVQPPFMNWAFNVFEPKLTEYWKAIPDETDVLITHSPPFMVGDYVPRSMQHEGSPSLYEEVIKRIKPKLHVFGHIHEGYGQWKIDETKFVNASNLDGDYMCVNDPVIIEI
jgi:Icc-related predicted phosphoesterase